MAFNTVKMEDAEIVTKASERETLRNIQRLNEWLKPTDSTSPASEYRKHLNSHVNGTCEWIFETDQYRDWSTIESDSVKNLWIRGIPGSGKSVVAAHTIARLHRLEDGPVLFFFFREIIQNNRSPHLLIRDFCHKLIPSSPYLQSVLSKVRNDFPAVESVPFDQLWGCLATALKLMEKVYCVVDALDEMEAGHDKWLEDFLRLGHEFSRTVKIITTSRQVPEVEKHMHRSCVVDLRLDRLHVDHDISLFVKQQLQDSHLGLGMAEIAEIKDALCEKGKGLFLYAKLMIDELLLNPKDILTRVHNLPDGLGDLYNNLLRESVTRSGTSTRLQRLILECVTHSARPMRILELTAMVESLPDRGGLEPESNVKDAVRTACGSLLEVCEDGVVQVIHHSLTEFLLSRDVEHTRMTSGHHKYHTIDSKAVHTTMARICLQYLMNGSLQKWDITQEDTDRPSDRKSLFLRFYFLRYAIQEWQFHVLKAGTLKNDLIRDLDSFCQDFSHNYQAWNQIWIAYRDDLPSSCSVLHVAAYSGLLLLAGHLLSRGLAPDITDVDYHTPLVYAIMGGHHEMVSLLLKQGASHGVKVKSKEYKPKSHIIPYACKMNNVEVVRALILGGVNPMAKASIGGGITRRMPLSPIDFDRGPYYMRSERDSSAVASAFTEGCVEAVLELIRLVDPEHLCEDNLVHLAAERAEHQILLELLKKLDSDSCKRKINEHDEYGDTPLYLAARNRSATAVRILLDHGADVSVLSMNKNFPPEPPTADESRVHPPSPASYTPLHAWALGIPRGVLLIRDADDAEACLDILVNAGCDINARDYRGRTALFEWSGLHLSSISAERFISALLARGADTSILDFDGQSPLHTSSEIVYQKVGTILTKAGCGINVQRQSDGMTVLMCNASQQNPPSPADFYNLGADFDLQDWQGNTALHHYCKKEFAGNMEDIDAWLLYSSKALHTQNYIGRTPLHEFIYRELKTNQNSDYGNERQLNGLKALAKIFNQGASLESQDGLGRSALLIALTANKYDPSKLVRKLLRMGASAKAKDFEGKSAFHYAFGTSRGYYRDNENFLQGLAQCLISAGADIEAIDFKGNAIFHHFVKHQSARLTSCELRAEMIMELGASCLQANHEGRTALHSAATIEDDLGAGNMDRTWLEFLLRPSMQFDVNAKDNGGITALHLAAAVSDINTLTLIQNGADVHVRDILGRTPLHFAALAGQSNVIGLLLEIYGANRTFINHHCSKRRSALHEASRSGSPECVSLLLNGGADLSLTDERGRTALHAAAEFKESSPAQKSESDYYSKPPSSAEARLNPRRRIEDKDSLSIEAREICSSGDDARCIREVVRLLLAAGADPNQTDEKDLRPLDLAVTLGCASVVEALREYMVGPTVQSFDPIREALLTVSDDQIKQIVGSAEVPQDHARFLAQLFTTGNERLVEEFLRAEKLKLIDRDHDKNLQSGIFLLPRFGLTSILARLLPYLGDAAASTIPVLLERATLRSFCNLTMVKLLVQHLPPVHRLSPADRKSLVASLVTLSAGERWWHPKAVVLLLEAGVMEGQSNEASRDAIDGALTRSSASRTRHRRKWNGETLRILLNHGIDPNAVRRERECSPIYTAVGNGADWEMIDLLLKYGASVDTRGSGLINIAIRSHNPVIVELLLEAGADANGAGDKRNIPLLERACCPNCRGVEFCSHREATMSLLLRYGANPLRAIKNGSTVLHKLCSDYFDNPLGPIIEMGLNLDVRDDKGRTPLMKCCKRGKCTMTLEMINAGVDIHATDLSGKTSLHWAAERGRADIVYELLKRSAAVNSRCNYGYRPLTLALESYAHKPTSADAMTINTLLDGGADPLSFLPDGRTALHCIATVLMDFSNVDRQRQIKEDEGADHFTEAISLYQRFYAADCDCNIADHNGNTPIFHYVRAPKSYNGRDNIDFACARKSNPEDYAHMFATHDIRRINLVGDTLLHVIARRKEALCDSDDHESSLFKLLVDLGLNPREENSDGQTPLDIAATQEKTKILALFARKE